METNNNNNNNNINNINNINNNIYNNEGVELQNVTSNENNNTKEIQIINYNEKDLEKNESSPSDDDKKEMKNFQSKYSKYNPRFYLTEYWDECKIIFASMFYKFAFETYSSALGLVVLTRFENDNGVTFLAIMNIIYFLSQSIGSMLVSPFVKKYRASRVTSCVMFSMAILITVFIIICASTGTKISVDQLGSWNRYLVVPLYCLMGIFVGMIEVSRKLTPRQILGSDNKKLSKLNGYIHLFYEISGTGGAFLSTPLIEKLGPVFALSHQPVFFLLGAIFFFWVSQPFPPTVIKTPKDVQAEKDGIIIHSFKTVGSGIYHYFYSLLVGARHILSVKYWWIITTYVLPQVLHRLLENLLFPTFAKKVLHQGSLSGILTGGSNFGEAVGSILVVKFGNRLKNPLWWVRIDGLFCSLVWVLVYPPKLSSPTAIACSMIPIWTLVSAFWAAGDISLLSFIQSKFPLNSHDNHDSDNVHQENSDTDSEKSDISDINTSTTNLTIKPMTPEESVDDLAKELGEQSTNNNQQQQQESSSSQSVEVENDISDEDDAPSGTPLASVLGFLFAMYAIIISLLSYGLGTGMDKSAANGDINDGFFWIAGVGFTVCGGLIVITSFFARNKELRKL
ncbi:hypothetical protein DDB_G0268862 [Dictyostelium discoideum AX4]|uniref:Major facilitator superfamily associated domain-containing protein n=1 Tax=Dictyostelium discoideum TaxID=44689 RepID=Q55EJ7_DICDI|nr:hypothetical protein DDB_G0268862 [Dictyostelium discoideum AX4]EAL73020.1 hypothetical protein DDB_G0268862 [Dictyostelium discoideum AX4]|eukprot:XP_647023.1 hypothetical protein DDB_G0268862 [Dictyostelium discoideum AX4]